MNKRVYILDDDTDLLEGMQIILQEHDFDPVIFSQSKDFWRKLKTETPDAVILDIGLSGEDGDVIAKKIKTSIKYKNVPVVLISATHDLQEKARKAKADSYLAKPFALDQFVQTIDGFVSSRNE